MGVAVIKATSFTMKLLPSLPKKAKHQRALFNVVCRLATIARLESSNKWKPTKLLVKRTELAADKSSLIPDKMPKKNLATNVVYRQATPLLLNYFSASYLFSGALKRPVIY